MAFVIIALVDFITLFFARFKKAREVRVSHKNNRDFTILIPIFGHVRYLRNIDYLKHYSQHVVLCTTHKESDEFNTSLEKIARDNGFRIFRSDIKLTSSKQRPNPWKLFSKTLDGSNKKVTDSSRDEIIRDSFSIVNTGYCIFLDGDTVGTANLAKVIGLMEEQDYDVASVRVLVAKPTSLIQKLQSIEYDFAMDARRVYPWLTSGACMITKTDAIKSIMNHHSLFFSGGDIEIGKLAKLLKYRVGHLAVDFFTDAPDTFRAWFKQRMAWSGGGFRHAIVNFNRYSWRHPLYYLYFTFIVYGMVAVRWYELLQYPVVVPFIIMLYWALLIIFQWQNRTWLFLLFPLYALVQVMLIIPLGSFRYMHMALQSKNVGIIRLRHSKPKSRGEIGWDSRKRAVEFS